MLVLPQSNFESPSEVGAGETVAPSQMQTVGGLLLLPSIRQMCEQEEETHHQAKTR
jgi:hypothetical protein